MKTENQIQRERKTDKEIKKLILEFLFKSDCFLKYIPSYNKTGNKKIVIKTQNQPKSWIYKRLIS